MDKNKQNKKNEQDYEIVVKAFVTFPCPIPAMGKPTNQTFQADRWFCSERRLKKTLVDVDTLATAGIHVQTSSLFMFGVWINTITITRMTDGEIVYRWERTWDDLRLFLGIDEGIGE